APERPRAPAGPAAGLRRSRRRGGPRARAQALPRPVGSGRPAVGRGRRVHAEVLRARDADERRRRPRLRRDLRRRGVARGAAALPSPAHAGRAFPQFPLVSNQSLTNEHERSEPMTRKPHMGWTFAITSIALFMVTLDNLVVTTALPRIREELHASLSSLEWTVNAYTL